jgi:hypothetical protein
MAALEVRQYVGDFEDIVALASRVWVGEYGGKTWAPLPEAAYLRERFAPETGAVCLVAVEGSKLVGSVMALPRTMRIDGTVHPVAMCTGFTVEPSNRRVALPLTERLRRLTEERGAAAGIGMVLGDPDSPSYRFWMKYAEAYPKTFRIVLKSGFWAKFLRPDVIARAGITRWERIASRVAGPVIRATPFGYDGNVRPYRATDLGRCLELVEATSRGVDWATSWTPEELAAQLGATQFTSLVYERGGTVRALVNCHAFPMQGRERVRCAMVDLWAEAGMTGSERVRFVSDLCTRLRDLGTDAVVVPRWTTVPAGALLANLFMPASPGFYIGMFPTERTQGLSPPRSWSFDVV